MAKHASKDLADAHRYVKSKKRTWGYDLKMNKSLYILAVPIIAFFVIFHYAPMAGLLMAFQNYEPRLGILGSEWVGMKNFIDFFTGSNFLTILRNTLVISGLGLVVGFPLEIVYSLLLNEIRAKRFKKISQTIHYMPYFISIVVVCGLIIEFVSSNGVITNILVTVFHFKRENLLQNPDYFWMINMISGIWQSLGYGSIFFIASMTAISGELYEAAAVDGAGRLRRAWHITIPGIMPAIMSMLIIRVGSVLNVGPDKILNLYNASIYSTADVISTHVQRMGLERMQYGYSTAVGLFNSVIGTILLLITNYISRKTTDSSLM